MSFTFKKCFDKNNNEIKGLYEIIPKIFNDNRGYFFESFNEKDFLDNGLNVHFVQDNQSESSKGVLRGLHFQTKHPQGKLVKVIYGRVCDVAVDLRNNSKTFGSYYKVILDGNLHNQIYIPEGFAHGFYVLSDKAVFSYKCTALYDPNGEGGIMWNDKTLNIKWCEDIDNDKKIILSEKDKKQETFNKDKIYFNFKDGQDL